MLRYYAPLKNFDFHLKRLLELCREGSIGEVVFIPNAEDCFSGFPPLSNIRQWAKAFRHGGEILRQHGVVMSLNPFFTLGHSGRGYPITKKQGFAIMVGDNGLVSDDTASPADPRWQRYIAEIFAIFATAHPEIMWLEDDFRLQNHPPVEWGCFAQPMLDRFAERTGKKWKREALVKAIVTGQGKTRSQWLKFTGDLWNEIVTKIRHAVHAVDPKIKLAQMIGAMENHSVGGLRWKEFLRAQAGPEHQPIVRPHVGPYRDFSGFDMCTGLAIFRHDLAFAGRGTRFCPEIDNGTHSYYSRSRRQTNLLIEICGFFGCHDFTFMPYAQTGNDPRNEPWVLRTLKESKGRRDALAAVEFNRRIEHGVHVWTEERAALFQKTDGMPLRLGSLLPSFDAWMRVFSRVGVASTYETPGKLTAVSGDTIRAADKEEVLRMLRGGLLLDGRAASALQEMGYGPYLGIKVGERRESGDVFPAPTERVTDKKFGQPGSPVMGMTQAGAGYGNIHLYLTKPQGAKVVSRFYGGDHKPLFPGVTLYQNKLGGRVAVFPYDFTCGMVDVLRFYHHMRKCQIQAVLRWLNHSQPVTASPDMAKIVVEHVTVDGMEYLAIINLNGDPMEEFTVNLSNAEKQSLQMLDEAGRWKRLGRVFVSKNLLRVKLPTPMESFRICFLRFSSRKKLAHRSQSV